MRLKTAIITLITIFTSSVLLANTLSLGDNGDGTWNVNYSSDGDIGGFQFNVDGATINSASGGADGAAGFMVSASATTALGFSLSGATIPAGDGVLVVLNLAGAPEGLSGIVVSDPDAIDMGFTYDNSNDGCTDKGACNYNADAAAEDGSCDYGTMCWNGSSQCDVADCPDIPVGTVEVYYNSDTPIAGFQFNIDGVVVTAASGGAATAAGFMVSSSAATVLGFSLTGSTIPAGEGVLVFLEVEGDVAAACLSDVIISDSAGAALDNMVEDCLTITYMAGCMDMDACNYNVDATGDDGSCIYAEENFDCEGNCLLEYDCANVCGGSSELDECSVCGGSGPAENYDCDGNCIAEIDCLGVCDGIAEIDCASECGGSAVEDVCGICEGDGSSCSSTIDILYDIDTPVAGFQFDIEGVEVLGASGGVAEDTGFSISISGNTVIGNSLTSLIPSGNGILVQVQVIENADPCLENIIFSDSNVSSENFESGFGSLGWDFSCTGFGCSDWDIDNTEFNTGAGSAKTGSINDNQSSDMSITLDIAVDGEIEFHYRVSAEYSPSGTAFYDGLEFYIDNTLLGQYQSTGTGGLGDSPWTYVSHNVTEGEHTFRWSYVKDGAGGGTDCDNTACEDAAWVDDIVFPITPLGNELHDCLEVVIISGCTEIMGTCNYDSNATNNDGTCTYVEENYDCEGNCMAEIDCANVCGGSSELDECAVCGGDGSGCDNPQATLSFGDLGGDVMLQVSYIDPNGDICIVDPVISDAVGVAVSTIVGECILLESSGSLDIYLNSSIDIAGFQFELSGLTITGASGGNAEANGFMISTSPSTVIGFSLTGSTIDANGSVGCMDESACNYDPDATIPGGCQYEVDCLGICGGMAEEDECGLCNGTGAEIECWDGELVCNAENCSDEPVFTDVDYLTEIQPILNANCTFYCHSGGGVYQGGLDLTSYENLMAGDSNHGPVVMPGDSENSILIQKLGDEPPFGDQMPQNGPPYLDAYTIALIAAWIDEGALPSDDDNEAVEGCMDPNANNYDSDATDDDGSCTYDPFGELTFGNIDYDNGTLEVNLDCEYPVSSFVFDLTGINLTGYYGGTTEAAGFDIIIEGATISGNSTGENVPANSGLLIVLTFDAYTAEEICFSNSNITTYVGIEYEAILDDCLIIEDDDDCVGQIDECGVCGGDNSSCADCNGIPNGDSVEDECGTCDNDNSNDCVDLSIDLIAGWNWISFNVNPEDTSLSSMLGSVGDDATFISSQSSGTAQNYGIYGWYGALTELDPTQMYKLQMTAAAELVITGVPVDVASTPISLIAGWNWIGYLPQNAGALGEALVSVGDDATFISSQSSGTAQNYGDYGWYGALTTLEPGNGYLLDMTGPGELVYPEFNGLARLDENKIEVVLSETISDWEFNYADYRYIGTITASIDSRKDFDKDVVGVFVDDQCRGLAKRMYFPFDDRYMYIIQAYSNVTESENMTFKYYDSAKDEVIEFGETISFTSNMIVGDGFNTFNLTQEVKELIIPTTYGLNDAYPNPFNPITSFSYSIPEDGNVQVAVYDLSGRMVAELVNGYQSAGSYPVVWDANELSSGVYMVNMISGDYSTIQKVMLIK